MSYESEEVKNFEKCKNDLLEKIHEYFSVAHAVVEKNDYTDIYNEKINDSIIKLMDFQRLVKTD